MNLFHKYYNLICYLPIKIIIIRYIFNLILVVLIFLDKLCKHDHHTIWVAIVCRKDFNISNFPS